MRVHGCHRGDTPARWTRAAPGPSPGGRAAAPRDPRATPMRIPSGASGARPSPLRRPRGPGVGWVGATAGPPPSPQYTPPPSASTRACRRAARAAGRATAGSANLQLLPACQRSHLPRTRPHHSTEHALSCGQHGNRALAGRRQGQATGIQGFVRRVSYTLQQMRHRSLHLRYSTRRKTHSAFTC